MPLSDTALTDELNNYGKRLLETFRSADLKIMTVDIVVIRWENQHFLVNQELVLLIMQYATKTYSTLSRISLLKSHRVYQITVQ